MPKFRTPKNDRAKYVYRDAYGTIVEVLNPGEDGVSEDHIRHLHALDDDERRAANRDSYYGLYHFDQANDEGEDIASDRQLDLADYTADSETRFFAKVKSAAIKIAWQRLLPQQRELVMKLLKKRTMVSIAAEEGVSETAIRNRLAKIQNKFKIFL